MASVLKVVIASVVGVIGLAIIGGVLLTLNAQELGGALPFLVAGFIPVAVALRILINAFGAT